mmetsp:Transcript_77838/g.166886  ORF Transcript_77838/g.166886 Transcript_77838/m.166886 type:complete len:747 (+) Transcript_77838:100-2340(+)
MMRTVLAKLATASCLAALPSSDDLQVLSCFEAVDTLSWLQVGLQVEHSELVANPTSSRNLTLPGEDKDTLQDRNTPGPQLMPPPRQQNASEAIPTPAHGDVVAGAPLRRTNLLLNGYNVFYGNPFTTSESDEGFVKHAGKPIFETRYELNQVTGNEHHLVPDGVLLTPVQSPSSCTTASVVSDVGRTHLLDSMSAFVAREEGGRAPGWFRASTDFRKFEDMQRRSLRNVIVLSECVVLNASIDVLGKELHPSATLLERVRGLPDTYEASEYFAFFDEFGTHVPSSASLGALTGVSAFTDEASYAQLQGHEKHLDNEAALERLMSGRDVSSRVQEGFLQRGEEAPTRLGSPRGTDAVLSFGSGWAQAASAAPVAVRLGLMPICSLFRREDVAVPAIRVELCERAARAEEYCMRHVMPREGLNPRTCLRDDYAGEDVECLWDSDCVTGSSCESNSCRHYSLLSMAFAEPEPTDETDAETPAGLMNPELQLRTRSFSYVLNLMVFIPWLAMAIPLGIIWSELRKLSNEKDSIWTAEDENLRHVEISSLGISGVALLRRPSDRRWAIRCAFISLLLQTAFLYFILVYDIASLSSSTKIIFVRTPALLFCALFINTMSCCSTMISGAKAWHTTAPEGYVTIHRWLVGLDSFIIPSVCIVAGTLFLCNSVGITSLIFSSTSMRFVVNFNAQFAGLLSWSLSAHGGRAFRPSEVLIKDDVDSMNYALRSLVFSFTVAFCTVLFGMIFVITRGA